MTKKTQSCCVCGVIFSSYNPNPKFCSLVCKSISQRMPVDDSKVTELYNSGLTQEEVALALGTTLKVVQNSMKRSGSPRRIACKRDQWGEKNHQWKGDAAGYSCLHKRLHRRYGKASSCQSAGRKKPCLRIDLEN